MISDSMLQRATTGWLDQEYSKKVSRSKVPVRVHWPRGEVGISSDPRVSVLLLLADLTLR